MSEQKISLEGKIKEALPNARFLVELDSGTIIQAYASGKMVKQHIRLVLGDRVRVEFSPYDLQKGRIIYRLPANQ